MSRVEKEPDDNWTGVGSGLGDVDLHGDPPPEAPDQGARMLRMLPDHLREL